MLRATPIILAAGLGILAEIASLQNAHAQSATACDAYARQYSKGSSRQGQVLGKGALGGLFGAGIGAIAGDSGVGAAVGATIGVIGGGKDRRNAEKQMYSAAYSDCISGHVR